MRRRDQMSRPGVFFEYLSFVDAELCIARATIKDKIATSLTSVATPPDSSQMSRFRCLNPFRSWFRLIDKPDVHSYRSLDIHCFNQFSTRPNRAFERSTRLCIAVHQSIQPSLEPPLTDTLVLLTRKSPFVSPRQITSSTAPISNILSRFCHATSPWPRIRLLSQPPSLASPFACSRFTFLSCHLAIHGRRFFAPC